MNEKARIYKLISFVCVTGILTYIFFHGAQFEDSAILQALSQNKVQGAVLFAFLMFGTTVLAPLSSLPLVPAVAMILGPFTTGLASFVGWLGGAIVAFLIGRYFGQPVVARFVSIESIQKYERYVEPKTSFMLILALRMILPVDILSYALGMFSTVSLRVYTLASAIGILWFSFAFAYMGEAFEKGDYVLLLSISVASVVVLYSAWRYASHIHRNNADGDSTRE